MVDSERRTNLSWIDAKYKGPLEVHAMLIKYKWNSGIGMFFSKFVTRFFVLDLEKFTFGYYENSSCKGTGCFISLTVN